MNDTEFVPNITLYLDNETQKSLRKLAERENRSISKQVKQVLEYYLKHKKEE